LQPANAAAWNSRCWTRAVIGQLQTALSDCNEALRLRPDYVHALDSRAFIHLKSGRYDEAIADYDAALRLDPKKVASLYGRGMAKRRKQDLAGGNADIAAARAIKADVSAEFARYGVSPPLPDTAVQREAEAPAPRARHPTRAPF
jgi:tetratricopeptide (TPR) repeat protein